MADQEFPHEDELESRQGAALYPVGRALRQTFDAENHDSLGTDLTGLMLELARIDPEARAARQPEVQTVTAGPSPVPSPVARVPWWRTVLGRLLPR